MDPLGPSLGMNPSHPLNLHLLGSLRLPPQRSYHLYTDSTKHLPLSLATILSDRFGKSLVLTWCCLSISGTSPSSSPTCSSSSHGIVRRVIEVEIANDGLTSRNDQNEYLWVPGIQKDENGACLFTKVAWEVGAVEAWESVERIELSQEDQAQDEADDELTSC
ncbi:hypothetical protein OG21DRAFT_1527526 [Imleria badia]|nr:hypothetical protein OG21DRAFT_1527526 [Imleria badia]